MWAYNIGVQVGVTEAQRQSNAIEFYNYFKSYGCTDECICGMLGNIDLESSLNPGNKNGASPSTAWGLIQWYPSTILTDWCRSRNFLWYDGAIQCYVIECEGEEKEGCGGRFITTAEYPYTWSQFTQLTDVNVATEAYLFERERTYTYAQISEHLPDYNKRHDYANYWLQKFSDDPPPPTPPTPPIPFKRKFPIIFMIPHYTH